MGQKETRAMNYTDLENIVDEDTRMIWWRVKHRHVELQCPKCFRFFKVPKEIRFDDNGYALGQIYHFCDDIYPEEENNEGWVVLPHLVGWSKI